ncbi:hypothetical protein [Flavobacterium sp.]|nr:hypothetical protein [Flavobacterium sp.]
MDTQKSNEAENDSFETIEPENDNPVKKGIRNWTAWPTGVSGR